MMKWQLWEFGAVEAEIDIATPLLASWEKKTDSSQVKLQSYLDDIRFRLEPLPENVPLSLHLDVDVQDPERLLKHHDLENYLTPLFGSRCLPHQNFHYVSARKFVGGGSRIFLGRAKIDETLEDRSWKYQLIQAGSGHTKPEWKDRIRQSLTESLSTPEPSGPLQVRFSWCCSQSRNWTSLWKPTGDSMGPVLGYARENNPNHVNDDRIVKIEFHRNINDDLKHDVVVGLWWKLL